MKIRVAITDDHPMVIDGLKAMLSHYDNIEIAGTYLNGEQLLLGLKTMPIDVLLLDIQLPGQTGDELTTILLKKYPDLRILTITNFESRLYINNMLRRGVHGYLLKTTDKETLLTAIETVFKGGQFIEPSLRESAMGLQQRSKEPIVKIKFSIKEKELLKLITEGRTTQEIADTMFLSHKTIEHYRSRIFEKLEVKNMAELTKKVLMMGLIE